MNKITSKYIGTYLRSKLKASITPKVTYEFLILLFSVMNFISSIPVFLRLGRRFHLKTSFLPSGR